MQHTGDRQIEVAVIVRQPGQAGAGDRNAVIALDPRDDLFLLRTAERIVVIPAELDRRVVRFEPELLKKTFDMAAGRRSSRRSANSMAGPCDLDAKL
jgi:hypothetical protein